MDTLALVDPELRPLIAAWPMFELSAETLPLMRDRSMPLPPIPEGLATREIVQTTGPDGNAIDLHVWRPVSPAPDPSAGILHIHGGGYVAGTAESMGFMLAPMAAATGCPIVSVEYRLAPETPHPGPVDDCYAALAWLHANAAMLGVDSTRIGVMGESAGGGLAAGLALLARDRGEYALAFQHLIYPMLDDRTCVAAEPNPWTGEFIWNRQHNLFGWTALLGVAPGGPDVSPYAAAARATDLAGLPPTYIATGALDLFVDENLDYAGRLIRAGVPTELHVYPGAYHGFHFDAKAAVTGIAQRDSTQALARALRTPD
jgi:acetyl esterase/lipase